jgi:hypothetical protein
MDPDPVNWLLNKSIWYEQLVMNKWISVKDRLPQEGEQVLVVTGSRGIVATTFCNSTYLFITHWQPLPEPPPPPDPFETWANIHHWEPNPDCVAIGNLRGGVDTLSTFCARVIWDAALASVKKG